MLAGWAWASDSVWRLPDCFLLAAPCLRFLSTPAQLYNLNSKYGSKEELLSLNRKLLEAGIRWVLAAGAASGSHPPPGPQPLAIPSGPRPASSCSPATLLPARPLAAAVQAGGGHRDQPPLRRPAGRKRRVESLRR